MVLQYGDTSIPSDSYTVVSGGTVQVGAAFERSVGLVGGMDTANGTATEGEVVNVSSSTDAADKFGDDSELYHQVTLALQNGATEVYALPVSETETTESFSSTSSGQLTNIPFFNPAIQNEHEITAQDTTEGVSVDVNIVYTDGAPSTPGDANTINLDYITGQFEADASSSYDITYEYGDYSASAIQPIVDESARNTIVLTEHSSVVNDLDTELQDNANNIDFSHGIAGAKPFESTSSPDTANYSDSIDSERISLVAGPYWYLDDEETNLQRAHGAVGGELASLPLGVSGTKNSVSGLESPRVSLTPSDASDLIDAQVLPLINYPPATIVKDMTTSTTQKFERVYAMNVVDEVIELSHQINNDYVGNQATEYNINQLARSHKNMLKGLTTPRPPLLASGDGTVPYAVSAERSDSAENEIDLLLGIDVVGVIDTIDVTLSVGDVVTAEVS